MLAFCAGIAIGGLVFGDLDFLVAAPREAWNEHGRAIALSGLLFATIALSALSWLGARARRSSRLRTLAAAVRRVSGVAPPPANDPEPLDPIADFATVVHDLAEKISEARQRLGAAESARLGLVEMLQHVDRVRIVGEMTASVAHELATPLTVVAGRARLVANDPAVPEAARTSARLCAEQAERMGAMVGAMLKFARKTSGDSGPIPLDAIIDDARHILTPLLKPRGVRLEFTVDAPAPSVRLEPSHLIQVLTNLVMNAAQASERESEVLVRVRVERRSGSEHPFAVIEVIDHGMGIEAADLPHLFEPFFTTKDSGTGLGLSVAQSIAQDHGGWIEAISTIGEGSTFRCFLPQA